MTDQTTETTLADFIQRLGLTMTATQIPARTDGLMEEDKPDLPEWRRQSHWLCVLGREPNLKITRPGMTINYSMGCGHRRWTRRVNFGDGRKWNKGDRCLWTHHGNLTVAEAECLSRNTEPIPPTVADVLDCLAMDASSYDNSRDFEDWASDFGMDTDSRKAERIYRVSGEQAKQLRHLLGDEAYRDLIEDVERL